ncbi:MAG: nucleotidyltransferase domain-containing protein [Deltaproteobacteria bacterium]|nr:nucleotidyltransferase domain-containing protein [Deltaproteobacteria bacterium]
MLDVPFLREVAHRTGRPIFATISGAHLYGFASADSDVDLRGAFVLPKRSVLGLFPANETVTLTDQSRCDLDWVAHDIRKFARMMTQHNGYVMEQLYSPIVVVDSPAFVELKELGRGCITRPTVNHYLGFARGRRKRLLEPDPTVKHLLYAYRVLMSGIHLMRTGEVVSHLGTLNALFRMSHVEELVARKRSGAEELAVFDTELTAHQTQLDRLEQALTAAHDSSSLPLVPSTVDALEDFVIRVRLESPA